MNLIRHIKSAIRKFKFKKSYLSVGNEDLREQMRMMQELKKQEKPNFGNAGGLNQPTDFARGFGGQAINDHLIRPPKENP